MSSTPDEPKELVAKYKGKTEGAEVYESAPLNPGEWTHVSTEPSASEPKLGVHSKVEADEFKQLLAATPAPSGEPKKCLRCGGLWCAEHDECLNMCSGGGEHSAQPLPSEPNCSCGTSHDSSWKQKMMWDNCPRHGRKPEEPLPTSPSEAGELEAHELLNRIFDRHNHPICDESCGKRGMREDLADLEAYVQQREAAARIEELEEFGATTYARTIIKDGVWYKAEDIKKALDDRISNLKKGNV